MTAAKRTAKPATAKRAAKKVSAAPTPRAADAGSSSTDADPPLELEPATIVDPKSKRPIWDGGELRQDYRRRLRAWEAAQK